MEFRIAVAKAYDECESSIEVAEMFNCSASWVRRLIQRRRLSDSLAPLPHKHPDTRKLREPELEQLRQLIKKKPDMTLAELAQALGNNVSVPTVCRATKKLGLTLKKVHACRGSTELAEVRAGPARRERETGRVV